jgi:RimJ/RimL family protein N-acetyltransferase
MPFLVNYNIVFLNKSWEWLNEPEIKALTMTPDFTKEEQLKFYKQLANKQDYWIKGIIEEDIPIGAMGLKHINTHNAEYWGYIGEKKYWGKMIGVYMLQQAILKAKELGLNQIYLIVHSNNTRAKKLYIKMGFQLSIAGEQEKYCLDV